MATIRDELRARKGSALWLSYFATAARGTRSAQQLVAFVGGAVKERFQFDDLMGRKIERDGWAKEVTGGGGDCVENSNGDFPFSYPPPPPDVDLAGHGGVSRKGRSINRRRRRPRRFPTPPRVAPAPLPFRGPPPTPPRTRLTCAQVRVILSLAQDSPAYDAAVQRGYPTVALPSLRPDEIDELVEAKLARAGQALPLGAKGQICAAPSAALPAVATALAEEIARLEARGEGGGADEYFQTLRPEGPLTLMDFILWTWERRFEKMGGGGMVRAVLTNLAVARWGLSEFELLGLVQDLARIDLEVFLRDISAYIATANGYLFVDSTPLLSAIEARYLPTASEGGAAHRRLAAFFRRLPVGWRRVDEEAWHWWRGGDWTNLARWECGDVC